MYKVVCGFNGTVYSRHKTRQASERQAERIRRSLRSPNCGNLAGYVQVVGINARFTNIVPADNEHGCCWVPNKRWIDTEGE